MFPAIAGRAGEAALCTAAPGGVAGFPASAWSYEAAAEHELAAEESVGLRRIRQLRRGDVCRPARVNA
jgi:hypothetical protein